MPRKIPTKAPDPAHLFAQHCVYHALRRNVTVSLVDLKYDRLESPAVRIRFGFPESKRWVLGYCLEGDYAILLRLHTPLRALDVPSEDPHSAIEITKAFLEDRYVP